MKALRRFTAAPTCRSGCPHWGSCRSTCAGRWDTPTQDLFASIDPELWVHTRRDPVALLGVVAPTRLDELAEDHAFLERLDHLAADLNDYLSRPMWYQEQQSAGVKLPTGIGYFSMEFGVAEVLPNYSGGLGILAGDHLKSASDLGVPLIGVGLLLPLRVLPAVADRRRLAARDIPGLGPAGTSAAAADRRRRRAGAGRAGAADSRQLRAQGLDRAGRPSAAAAARLRHRGERARAAQRHRPAVRR